jgi:GxxExxY protein
MRVHIGSNHREFRAESRGVKRQDATDAKGAGEPDEELDGLARSVVGAALEVHRALGAGFVESVYEEALCIELSCREVPFRRQLRVSVRYKGRRVGHGQLDLLVGDRLVVELKAVEALAPIHGVQLRSYLKATGCSLGLLINFNVPLLRDGIRRIILSSSNHGGLGVLAFPFP